MADANAIANTGALVELRLRGQRPALQYVWFGGGGRLRGCEVGIEDGANIERLDLRPFVELNVLVIAQRYSPKCMRLCERLNEYAETTTLSIIDWLPDDLGVVWTKGHVEPRQLGAGSAGHKEAA